MDLQCNTQVLPFETLHYAGFFLTGNSQSAIIWHTKQKGATMKAQELETKSAGYYAFAAARDASMRAVAMWSHYTDRERVRAERIKIGLEMVYNAKAVHINPRGKFIAIKVDQARVRDRKMLALLEKDYELLSITKVVTEQGITYRIPKI
jgi:hypothetical protein